MLKEQNERLHKEILENAHNITYFTKSRKKWRKKYEESANELRILKHHLKNINVEGSATKRDSHELLDKDIGEKIKELADEYGVSYTDSNDES